MLDGPYPTRSIRHVGVDPIHPQRSKTIMMTCRLIRGHVPVFFSGGSRDDGVYKDGGESYLTFINLSIESIPSNLHSLNV
jgi:hypothetical protein